MKGVISKGILSRSEILPTGVLLSTYRTSLHGSILTRPPSGRATISFAAGLSSVSAATAELAKTASPNRGLIKLGICGARCLKLRHEQASRFELAFVGRVLQQLIRFRASRLVIRRRARELELPDSLLLILAQKTIVEAEFANPPDWTESRGRGARPASPRA